MNDNNFINLTFNGWTKLINSYGHQLTTLILQECDIDDNQLAIIINGFRRLVYLDITNNRLVNSYALCNLPSTIKYLNVGSKISGYISYHFRYIPMEPIAAGYGRLITELHLQGIIDEKFILINQLKNLKKLTIHFIKPVIDVDTIEYFSAIQHLNNLESLEIYQVRYLYSFKNKI